MYLCVSGADKAVGPDEHGEDVILDELDVLLGEDDDHLLPRGPQGLQTHSVKGSDLSHLSTEHLSGK